MVSGIELDPLSISLFDQSAKLPAHSFRIDHANILNLSWFGSSAIRCRQKQLTEIKIATELPLSNGIEIGSGLRWKKIQLAMSERH